MKMQKLIIAFCHLPKGKRTPYSEICPPGIQKDLSDNLFLRYGKSLILLTLLQADRFHSFTELLFAKIKTSQLIVKKMPYSDILNNFEAQDKKCNL